MNCLSCGGGFCKTHPEYLGGPRALVSQYAQPSGAHRHLLEQALPKWPRWSGRLLQPKRQLVRDRRRSASAASV
jgi:hypothetical protein